VSVKITSGGRHAKVQVELGKLGKFAEIIKEKFNSRDSNAMGGFLDTFGKKIVSAVVERYVMTASTSEDMMKRRMKLYGSINPLDGLLGRQINYSEYSKIDNGWELIIGNPTLYPLGQGAPFYSIFQEGGTKGSPMTPYVLGQKIDKATGTIVNIMHPGLPNREFLLTGFIFGLQNVGNDISAEIKRWINEASNIK